ncbi:MAG: glutamate 5-kinase [Atribacterota bacterium]|nr:glutamate 5-kinase [Atribacterota bacterium]
MIQMKTFEEIKRVVIKIGTSTIVNNSGVINYLCLEKLAAVVSNLHTQGKEVVIVTSGAIGVGSSKFKLQQKPRKLAEKQAMASIGQGLLIHLYENIFSKYNIVVGQMLFTREDLEDKVRHHNTCNTFNALFEYNVIPIVNENDTVAVEEIVYGDNDTLSAVVSVLIKADLLIMLSDTDGLYSGDFRKDKNSRKISYVKVIDDEIESYACGVGSSFGTGGMKTKISAAKLATAKGIAVAIIKGDEPEQILELIKGNNTGTIFLPDKKEAYN